MSLFGLEFSQMILHTEASKLMYNWSFLFEVLHKPTLLPSTFKKLVIQFSDYMTTDKLQTKEMCRYTVWHHQAVHV